MSAHLPSLDRFPVTKPGWKSMNIKGMYLDLRTMQRFCIAMCSWQNASFNSNLVVKPS